LIADGAPVVVTGALFLAIEELTPITHSPQRIFSSTLRLGQVEPAFAHMAARGVFAVLKERNE
jgi:uncharacterized glyoxalase superfamily metalloenzyme YdcJ